MSIALLLVLGDDEVAEGVDHARRPAGTTTVVVAASMIAGAATRWPA